MTHQRNETPEPLAGATVESCISALVIALPQDKGWLHGYADSVVRDAIDRKHLEPLAQEQEGEYRSLYEISGCIADANTMLIGRNELKAKDAEIARLKAIKSAISDYHYALDMRQHGGVAQDQAFNAICEAMGMHWWHQGEEKARRDAMKGEANG